MSTYLGGRAGGDTPKGVAFSNPMQRPAPRPLALSWGETWQEHVQTALCIDLLNEGQPSVDDLHAILLRLFRACQEVQRLLMEASPSLGLNPSGKCECGCGENTALARRNEKKYGHVKGQPLRFLPHHWTAKMGQLNFRHGMIHTPTYRSWQSMMTRCYNAKQSRVYDDYGAKGIKVADVWHSFEQFWRDVGTRPSGHTLDRIDNSRGYEPGNVRWADRFQQAANRRSTAYVTWKGITSHVTDWAKTTGIGRKTIAWRLAHGWSADEALTLPADSRPRHMRKAAHAVHLEIARQRLSVTP